MASQNSAQNGFADNAGISGMDINVEPVYSVYGLIGMGVILAVVDTGLEIAHEDLAINVVSGGSWNFIVGNATPTDPTNTLITTGDHGTSVGGLIAMANNTIGGIGVAPGASLKGFNLLSGSSYVSDYVTALGGSISNPNSINVVIFNQSYIVIGAINAKGKKSSYSSAGSAIWVSAPGGEYGNNASVNPGAASSFVYDPAMITTDQSGCAKGYSVTAATSSMFNKGTENTACNYTNSFNGTSSAAPVISGVAALILDANPTLSWRDVKHILASTSRQIDASIAPVTVVLSSINAACVGTYTAVTFFCAL